MSHGRPEDLRETERVEALKDGCTCAWHDVSTFAERDAVMRGKPDWNCPVHAESDLADRRQRANEMWWQARERRDEPERTGFWRRLWTGLREMFRVKR